MTSFIHLRTHSEYSLIDGMLRVDELVNHCYEAGMGAVAITDHMNLFAAVKFYKAALLAGIKPIIGADLWLENAQDPTHPFRLTLLCQNQTGYQQLTRLISKAYTEGDNQLIPLIKTAWLEGATEGLIALSGAQEGNIGGALLAGNQDLAVTCLHACLKLFPGRFYLELQRLNRAQEEEYIQAVLPLAQSTHTPVVATNDVRFLINSDFEAHEARVCIHAGRVLEDPTRPKFYTAQQYLKSPHEMESLFADIPSALENTLEIVKRCTLTLSLGKVFLPKFITPTQASPEEYLIEQARLGLNERLNIFKPEADPALYHDRLETELSVINKIGFASYFLIVADFIQWSKQHGIPVGPGRGSGAGSLVAYALKITDIDPLPYGLLFERFLNPERVSMPDFDVDFCMDGRDRVIEYVAGRYGRDHVSQIITYGSMAAKAVVRDVGRVLGHPYGFVDKIAKLIPFELGITLEKALAQEPQLRQRYTEEEEVKLLIDLALKLEGLARNAGKHAGGVVVAPSALTDFTPLYCEPGSQHYVTQFDKDDVEAIGLVKFDFLGLRTLTIINNAVNLINQHRETPLDINLISLTDAKIFELLKSCATTAVFQLESRGMKDLIRRLIPDCFEEIIALVALFRPGPLQSGMVDDFINRKHGRAKVSYPHPSLEPILKQTYGVILYQEQVMQIAQVLAGYTLGAADLLRRAMGKKKPEEMAKQRKIFTEGATKQGVSEGLANQIFDLMEKFAGYGFNKSHSAAYALVSYQTAWLKGHYPAEFMAAVLSSDMDNTDKVVAFLVECKAMGLAILPPDINRSDYQFTVNPDKTLRYGLGAIKGVGLAAIETIKEARQTPFLSFFDFCKRMDLFKVNRRVLEALIRSGALDSLNPNRHHLMTSIDKALQMAEQHHKNKKMRQVDLFGSALEDTEESCVETPKWDEMTRLNGEKETLGHYLTGHPLMRYQSELTHFITCKLNELDKQANRTVVIAGLIGALKIRLTRKNEKMAIVTLEDSETQIDLVFFPEIFNKSQHFLAPDNIIVVEGAIAMDEFTQSHRVTCRHVFTLEQARQQFGKMLLMRMNSQQTIQDKLPLLKQLLKPHVGGKFPIQIEYLKGDQTIKLTLDSSWRIKPTNELIAHLADLLGEKQVEIVYN